MFYSLFQLIGIFLLFVLFVILMFVVLKNADKIGVAGTLFGVFIFLYLIFGILKAFQNNRIIKTKNYFFISLAVILLILFFAAMLRILRICGNITFQKRRNLIKQAKTDEDAKCLLGIYLLSGNAEHGIVKNKNKGLKILEKLAYKNHIEALKKLGTFFLDEENYDVEKSKYYFNKAALLGNGYACYRLGKIAEENNDYSEAFHMYQKASDFQDKYGQYELGLMYFKGGVVGKDIAVALSYLEKSANNGFVKAQKKLGDMYFNGDGVKKDWNTAIKYYLLATKQSSFDCGPYYKLGYIYSRCTAPNYSKAFSYFEVAANWGDIYAENELGHFYYNGLGVNRDPSKAFNYFLKSSKGDYAVAQCNLALCYKIGFGTPIDLEKAKYYYEEAASKNHVPAMRMLASMYCSDNNGRNLEKAQHYFELGAKNGDEYCSQKLEELFEYRKAIDNEGNNDSDTLYVLGKEYYNGTFCNKDYSKALFYLEKASELNNGDAQWIISKIYLNGWGVNKDKEKSRHYIELASQNGCTEAKKYLLSLKSEDRFKGDYEILDIYRNKINTFLEEGYYDEIVVNARNLLERVLFRYLKKYEPGHIEDYIFDKIRVLEYHLDQRVINIMHKIRMLGNQGAHSGNSDEVLTFNDVVDVPDLVDELLKYYKMEFPENN